MDKEYVIDSATISSTQILFDYMAESLSEFIQEHGIRERLPLAFIFSLPIVQHSITSGTLTRCTNYFRPLEGAVGKDVVKLLEDAIFVRRKVRFWFFQYIPRYILHENRIYYCVQVPWPLARPQTS